MRKFKGRRPSPTMIVAGVALIVALTGTAIAAPTAIKSVLNKGEKKQVKKIAKNQVNKLGPKLSVANAKNLDGKPPSAFLPLAYGHIANATTGALDGGKSSNLQSAKGNAAGRYCFEVVSGDPTNVQATVDYDNSPSGATAPQVRIPAANFGCPSGVDDFTVQAYNNGGIINDMAVYLLVH